MAGGLSGIMIYFKAFQKRQATEIFLFGELLVGALTLSGVEYEIICAGTVGCTQAKPEFCANFQWMKGGSSLHESLYRVKAWLCWRSRTLILRF